MTTDIKTVASFIATAIWADGEYDEAEKVAVSEIADALGYDEIDFTKAVDDAIAKIKDYDEDKVNDFLQEVSDKVADEEIGEIFECALEVVLADGIISEDEVNELLVMAAALGISDEAAVLMLVDMVKDEPELKVKL